MTEAPARTLDKTPDIIVLELTADEVSLVRAALRLLRATLGRDEAEELHEVKLLLAKLGDG